MAIKIAFVLLSCIILTATSQYSTSNKGKRSLYGLSDQELFSRDFYKSNGELFNHVIQHGNIAPAYKFPTTSTAQLLQQSWSPSTSGFGVDYLNYGVPLISNHLSPIDTSYIANGRLLKQYAVKEFSHDHAHSLATTNNLLGGKKFFFENQRMPFFSQVQGPFVLPTVIPQNQYLPTNFQLIPQRPLFQPAGQRGPPTIVNLAKNHGPVALGSGALGYIRLPNGGIYLGSGSLGYIDQQKHTSDITTAFNRQGKMSQAGPLSFGHGN